jgi:hypothetical protein
MLAEVVQKGVWVDGLDVVYRVGETRPVWKPCNQAPITSETYFGITSDHVAVTNVEFTEPCTPLTIQLCLGRSGGGLPDAS